MKVAKQASDKQLINAILKGDKNAFQQLYSRYVRDFSLICYRYAKDKQTSEDYLQDAFISIYRSLEQFDENRGAFNFWAKRVVINTCLQNLRKKNIFSDYENIFEINLNAVTYSKALENLSLQELTTRIKALPKGYRTVFNLYVIDGFNHREISEMLGIAESTSKTQLLKARKYLQKNLSSEEYQISHSYA